MPLRRDNTSSAIDPPRLERRIAHDYFVRLHMSVILAAVISSGVLTSKCLMLLGASLRFRFPVAVLVSYAIFLLLIRVWIWYVSVRTLGISQLANLDFSGSGSGGSLDLSGTGGSGGSGSGGFSGFGGGTSGGGGASSSWEGNGAAALVSQPSSVPASSSGSHWWPDLGFDFDDDSGWVIVILIALVACILGGGLYLVYAAPHILPEAAGQVLLAGTLTRVSKEHHHGWMSGVVRSTWIPFLIVLVLAGALGWQAQSHCPAAHRLVEVLNCPAN
jgi:hypothetical protein